jgi:hypothetical protein
MPPDVSAVQSTNLVMLPGKKACIPDIPNLTVRTQTKWGMGESWTECRLLWSSLCADQLALLSSGKENCILDTPIPATGTQTEWVLGYFQDERRLSQFGLPVDKQDLLSGKSLANLTCVTERWKPR